MTTPDDQVILYPAGGCFNRLRSEQTFLNNLLRSSFEGWEKAENKKKFVISSILGKIPGGIWIYDRESGRAIRPEKKDAENRILQKMRDLKKSLYRNGYFPQYPGVNDGDSVSLATTVSGTSSLPRARRTNRKPKPSSTKASKKAISEASAAKKKSSKKGKVETYFDYVMEDGAYETDATAAETEVSSPDSQASASSLSELKQLREEVKFLQTLCVDQKRHIRWLKNKISSIKEKENDPHATN